MVAAVVGGGLITAGIVATAKSLIKNMELNMQQLGKKD
ncbi:hypothetical protein LOS22_15665 [Enterococcus faecium]|nr:hypothetical protein [Enterococcus faecium]